VGAENKDEGSESKASRHVFSEKGNRKKGGKEAN